MYILKISPTQKSLSISERLYLKTKFVNDKKVKHNIQNTTNPRAHKYFNFLGAISCWLLAESSWRREALTRLHSPLMRCAKPQKSGTHIIYMYVHKLSALLSRSLSTCVWRFAGFCLHSVNRFVYLDQIMPSRSSAMHALPRALSFRVCSEIYKCARGERTRALMCHSSITAERCECVFA